MKFIGATAFLASTVIANLENMQIQLNDIKQLSEEIQDATMIRSLDDKGQFSLWLDDVNEYGCWCYFGEKHGAGKSQPVNDLDAHCKQLHEGYECAMIDDAGQDCTPWTVAYSPVNYLLDDGTVYAACDSANGVNTCASRACAVESRFLRDVSMWSIFNFLDLATYSHNQGTFNATDTCHVNMGAASPRSCCGTYPTRFPYRTLDGGHDCCVDKIFNTATTDCCADGTIGIVGTC